MRRVVITGLGVVAATGVTVADFFSQLLEGRAGTRRIQNMEPALAERLSCKIAAEVPCFDPSQHFDAKELDQLDRFSQFAAVAAKQALEDAGRGEFSEEEQNRLGVCVGTAYGGIETLDSAYFSLYEKNASRLPPLVLPRSKT